MLFTEQRVVHLQFFSRAATDMIFPLATFRVEIGLPRTSS